VTDCGINKECRAFRRLFTLVVCGIATGCGTPESSPAQPTDQVRVIPQKPTNEPSSVNDDVLPRDIVDGDHVAASVFRRSQPDPHLNAKRLAASGIHVLQSDRLILLTDRDPATVQDLPAIADALFEHLHQACGPLRPTEQGAEFQAIGCLMSDVDRFETAGLIPEEIGALRHGQQWGYRFWVRDQDEVYYRRHLVLHEFVHVYMTVDTPANDLLGQWFMEAAAELYATHRKAAAGPEFAVMPHGFRGFDGWGRISAIRRRRIDLPGDGAERQPLPSLTEVLSGAAGQQVQDANYRWWWALGWMLNRHPNYCDHWEHLCHCRSQTEFDTAFASLTSVERNRLNTDWLLFCESLCGGFDPNRSFARHSPNETYPATVHVLADQGWQDTGCDVKSEDQLNVSSSGRCVLNDTTIPWESESNGITLEYNQGRPIGELVAVLVDSKNAVVSRRMTVGKEWAWNSTTSGRLWLQINDSEHDRANNSGEYVVQILNE